MGASARASLATTYGLAAYIAIGGATAAAADAPVIGGVLRLKAGEIETATRNNLLASETAIIQDGERLLLQLDAPMTAQRRNALRATGIRLGEYLPEFSYIVSGEFDLDALRGLGFVSWLGRFEAAWKIDPAFGTLPLTSADRIEARNAGVVQSVVVLFPGAELVGVQGAISEAGAVLLGASMVGSQWMLDAQLTTEQASALAARMDVQFIEEAAEHGPRNNSNRWIVQSNINALTPVWDRGLHGEEQIIGIIDTTPRESHCMFDDFAAPGTAAHRKFVGWRNAAASGESHGTHVAGTLAGDAPPYNEYTTNDGLAYAARMSFSGAQSVWSNPATLYPRLLDAHNDGAAVHTNSWGSDATRNYTTTCRQIDQFTYEFENDLVLVAVSYSPVVTTPENALNALSVAASQDFPNQHQYAEGGTGPTLDGRRKPEIFAPGQGTISAAAWLECGTTGDSGTSMACPVVAAAATLTRQYFMTGLYPSGAPRTDDGFVPSGSLIRAVVLNGGVDMTGIPDYPSLVEGWGRLLLDNSLYFSGDADRLIIADVRNADGLSTGEFAELEFEVTSVDRALRITMAFTQPPAVVNAADPVINNLDLEILSPSGALYRGNVFAGGQSATGGTADTRNNVERIVLNTPEVGTYTAIVRGTAVNAAEGHGLQGFALAINGAVTDGCVNPPLGDMDADCQVGLSDLTALLSTFGLCSGDAGFNGAADFNATGCVDLNDLTTLLANFGV